MVCLQVVQKYFIVDLIYNSQVSVLVDMVWVLVLVHMVSDFWSWCTWHDGLGPSLWHGLVLVLI